MNPVGVRIKELMDKYLRPGQFEQSSNIQNYEPRGGSNQRING